MCGNNQEGCAGGMGSCKEAGKCCGAKCIPAVVGKVLVIVGGLNWGLVGLGMLVGNMDWNVVHMVLGSVPVLEGVVYVLVGLAAVMQIFSCKCKMCMGGSCAVEGKTEEKTS